MRSYQHVHHSSSRLSAIVARIVFLNNQGLGEVGGGVTMLRHLAEDLARDHAVTVASYDVPVGHAAIAEVRIAAPGEPGRAWRIAPLRRAWHLRQAVPRALLDAADLVVVLDCHFAAPVRAAMGRRATARRGGRRLIHLALSCTPAQERAGGAGGLIARQYAWLEARLGRAADQIIVSSRLQAAEMERESGLPAAAARVLYPTLPASLPPSPLPARDARGCVILCAGRLVPGKSFDAALRLLAGLAGLDWRLLVAGDGPERARLAAEATRLGIGERVEFLGAQPSIEPLLARADLLVHPSRYESFGMALFEAMRAGRPAVAAAAPALIGLRELVGPPSDADAPSPVDFIDFTSPEGAARVARLITDTALRTASGQAARAFAERQLTTSYAAGFRAIAGLRPA